MRNDSLVLSVPLENRERADGHRYTEWFGEEPQEHIDMVINSKK